MKYCVVSILLTLACSPQQITPSEAEIRAALTKYDVRLVSYGTAALHEGTECAFVLKENTRGDQQGIFIMERRQGELRVVYTSPSWHGMRAASTNVTDIGHDGRKEFEVVLESGRRIYYLHDGKGYAGEDVLAYHGMTDHGMFRDEVFYKDLDGDGIEEALVVYGHDFRSPFDARKWNHGWRRTYENDYLRRIREDYEAAVKSPMDALGVEQRKQEIRQKLLEYARQ